VKRWIVTCHAKIILAKLKKYTVDEFGGMDVGRVELKARNL